MKASFLILTMVSIGLRLPAHELNGRVLDAVTDKAIPYATIYIEGSTIGTTSGPEGYFSLESPFSQASVVCRHVGYHTQMYQWNKDQPGDPVFRMEPRLISVEEVVVAGLDQRQKNLQSFRELFLGEDEWGKEAEILNDSVIEFRLEKDRDGRKRFAVQTSAPLLIRLNLTGYLLEHDLIHFELAHDDQIGAQVLSRKGYSYFRPDEEGPGRKTRRIHRNRLKAYYNSSMHFLRAFHDDQLARNGFDLYLDGTTNSFVRDSCDCIRMVDGGVVLYGLRGERFSVIYHTRGTRPANLENQHSGIHLSASGFFVKEDSCLIRSDGTVPGRQLVFSGQMVNKRIGASLPADYLPGY